MQLHMQMRMRMQMHMQMQILMRMRVQVHMHMCMQMRMRMRMQMQTWRTAPHNRTAGREGDEGQVDGSVAVGESAGCLMSAVTTRRS